jgi:hypothetical protein
MDTLLRVAFWACIVGANVLIWRTGLSAWPQRDKIGSAFLIVVSFVLWSLISLT